jgi:hypothetical protein
MSLIEISEVEDYVEYLSDNADRIYIDTCVGQRFTEEEENDGNTQTGRYTKRGIKILRGTLYTVQLNLDDFTW